MKLPDPPKPPLRFAAAARLVPPDRMFTLSDGAAIPARVWKAEGKPRGILLALHGFNDSRDAWEQPAPFFAEQGITVVAPDQRGFGEAPKRGEWAGSDRMVQDVREEIAMLQQENPQIPLYLTGESMGGRSSHASDVWRGCAICCGYIAVSACCVEFGPWGRYSTGCSGNALSAPFGHRAGTAGACGSK